MHETNESIDIETLLGNTNNPYSEMISIVDSGDIHEAIAEIVDHVVSGGAPLPCDRNLLIDLTTDATMKTLRNLSENIEQVMILTGSSPKKGLVYGTVVTKMVTMVLTTLQSAVSDHARKRVFGDMMSAMGIDPAMAEAMLKEGVHKD